MDDGPRTIAWRSSCASRVESGWVGLAECGSRSGSVDVLRGRGALCGRHGAVCLRGCRGDSCRVARTVAARTIHEARRTRPHRIVARELSGRDPRALPVRSLSFQVPALVRVPASAGRRSMGKAEPSGDAGMGGGRGGVRIRNSSSGRHGCGWPAATADTRGARRGTLPCGVDPGRERTSAAQRLRSSRGAPVERGWPGAGRCIVPGASRWRRARATRIRSAFSCVGDRAGAARVRG